MSLHYTELYADRLPAQRKAIWGIPTVHTPQPEYKSEEESRAALERTVRHLPVVQRPAPKDTKAYIVEPADFRANQPAPVRAAASAERAKKQDAVTVTVKRKPGPKPKPRRVKVRQRRLITEKRAKGECDHMQDGELIWHRGGFRSGEQRYWCPSCESAGFMVDGVITASIPRAKRVADVPKDMNAFLSEVAAQNGATLDEIYGTSRIARISDARRSCVRALRARNLTYRRIADIMRITYGGAMYFAEAAA